MIPQIGGSAPGRPRRKKTKNYLNNGDFLTAIREYRTKLLGAKEGERPPRIPNYIAECVMKIATHLSFRPNFSSYTFKDEMILDGIENGLSAVKNFDPDKGSNPFGYFTTVIAYAFIRRIQTEKKYLYTKYAATRRANLTRLTSGVQEGDTGDYDTSVQYGEWSQEQMDTFMDDFEKSRDKKEKRGREQPSANTSE